MAATSPLKTHSNPNPNPNPKRRPTTNAAAALPIVFSGGTWCCSDMDYSRFNHALTAGLLNPMSPPPQPPAGAAADKSRSSPTLFEMMASEQDAMLHRSSPAMKPAAAAFLDLQQLRQERVAEILGSSSPGGRFNDAASGDVKLTLTSKDGFSVSLALHRQILAAHSRFFSSKLKHHPTPPSPYVVEISDCDDVEIYLETLRLMYCHDLRRRLMREDVPKVLGILKISAAIAFDAGVLSCLEYLEAAPWAEDEEEKVAGVLSQLRLDAPGAGDVMRRVTLDDCRPSSGCGDLSGAGGEILVRLLQVVLAGKDEKARRDMKTMVHKMLRELASQTDLILTGLHEAADECLRALRVHFGPNGDPTQIARQSDNLHWLLDILIDRQVGEEFAAAWAGEEALADAHCRVPAIHRHEVSRVTARLLVGIGKGQVLVGKEVRCRLLRTWLDPFYEDFGWMKRACKGLDRHLVEDGLGSTILTLPMDWQQEFLMGWFGRFLNSGDDCPNLQRAFEVWWRRAFWRRNGDAMR